MCFALALDTYTVCFSTSAIISSYCFFHGIYIHHYRNKCLVGNILIQNISHLGICWLARSCKLFAKCYFCRYLVTHSAWTNHLLVFPYMLAQSSCPIKLQWVQPSILEKFFRHIFTGFTKLSQWLNKLLPSISLVLVTGCASYHS